MGVLIVFNLILFAIIAGGIFLCFKFIKKESTKKLLFILAAVATILCHYSSLIYHLIVDHECWTFLRGNPNLLLPIYPCNVVMWGCLIYAFLKKESRASKYLGDFLFLFGTVSALVGMLVNVDFVNNPTLGNYDVTKGIVAHGFMLFNVLLIPFMGRFKISFLRNIISIGIGIVAMFIIGCYCNIVFEALVDHDMANVVNSMFIMHSPFDGVNWLTYPVIAGVALVAYAGILALTTAIAKKPFFVKEDL